MALIKTAISRSLFSKVPITVKILRQASRTHWQNTVKDMDPKQVDSYFREQLIMVDNYDSVLGPISKGESHAIETVKRGVFHRALSLLIFDDQDRFLLTQRAGGKITFPNYYTNACCSHPLFNESEIENDGHAIGVKRATLRRCNFELGTHLKDIKLEDLKFVNRLAYRAESDGGKWGEAEIDYILILHKSVELNPNPDEVQSFRYVTKNELRNLLMGSDSNVKVTPWIRLLSRDHLFKYWDNLRNLDKVAEPNTILYYKELQLA